MLASCIDFFGLRTTKLLILQLQASSFTWRVSLFMTFNGWRRQSIVSGFFKIHIFIAFSVFPRSMYVLILRNEESITRALRTQRLVSLTVCNGPTWVNGRWAGEWFNWKTQSSREASRKGTRGAESRSFASRMLKMEISRHKRSRKAP